MQTHIKKVAILGSGIMGSAIACHLANVGLQVLLLDILPPGLTEEQKKEKIFRNQLVNTSLQKAIKAKPAALFKRAYADRIETGNFEDDLEKISDCDWILEAIIEDPVIKSALYHKVDQYRKEGSIISSNTSGIPISMLAKEQSASFRKNFLGIHFFNPPRYLSLLEIIPGDESSKEVIDFFIDFGRSILGKDTVLCKDTPAFIANRIGVFSILKILELTEKYGFNIETVDALTGRAIGRPKTGTFRLQDLIGVDVGMHVLDGVAKNCPKDTYLSEQGKKATPPYIQYLLDNKFFGNKSGQGFYKKTKEKDENGKSIILALDLKEKQYRPKQRPTLKSIGESKRIEELGERLKFFFREGDEGHLFIQEYFLELFAYVANRIPEISDQLYSIDEAMKGGYAWDLGPFEYWDMLGLEKGIKGIRNSGIALAPWVDEMLQKGFTSFYRFQNGAQLVYDPQKGKYVPLPGAEKKIYLQQLREKIIFENSEAKLYDIGDGVICLEFTSPNKVIGHGTGEAMHKAIDLAESESWKGVVIGHNDPNFTVGANLMLVAMTAYQQEWTQLEQMIRAFQEINMRLRYSSVPVVTATKGYVFGGGIEMSMHADSVAAAAESYIGLVEAGVGLIPGGGGTKEFALRLSDSFYEGDIMMPKLIERFKTIAMAEVATSAAMAFDFHYLLEEKDFIVLNGKEHIHAAKTKVLQLAENYLPPTPKKIKVLGRSGLATLKAAISEFKLAGYISDHDALIAGKTANIMCGGDLSEAQRVSEKYLLDLEVEAFLSLCGEKKTLDRIQHMLQFNKPLRN
jgi:3-hydroxyacyl-CoA dehydrogenase